MIARTTHLALWLIVAAVALIGGPMGIFMTGAALLAGDLGGVLAPLGLWTLASFALGACWAAIMGTPAPTRAR